MKNIIYIMCIGICLASCEDVVELDIETTESRLVIDAAIHWERGTTGNNQKIELSLTAPFFDNIIPPATGATVFVTDNFGNNFSFIENANSGIYENSTFMPAINEDYYLTIIYNSETYTASERLLPVVPVEFVEQKNDAGFSGDETEIKAFYTDPENIENYYLFEFSQANKNILDIEVYDDEFTDGNQIFAFFSDEDIEAGEELKIRSFGVSERFYGFMNILLEQADDESGGPFETQPTSVRGNCVNQTNPDNYPLGYFRASEFSEFTYVIE